MSLSAHTNLPGNLTQRTVLSERQYGREATYVGDTLQWVTFDRVSKIFTGRGIAYSSKPLPVKGDRKKSLSYFRVIKKVITDEPYLIHTKWINPSAETGGINGSYDYIQQRLISVLHTPFSYNPSSTFGSYVSNARAEADVKALNDLAKTKLQIGANIGEARQTVDMFADAVSAGAKFLLAVKRRDISALRKYVGRRKHISEGSNHAANLWLQYSYGWKPLADDIHNSNEMMLQSLDRDFPVKGKGSGKWETTHPFPYRNEDWIETFKINIRTVLKAKISNSFLQNLDRHGLLNPASIAWELVPWSFAIDWFIPVGATLEALTATVGLTFEDGYRSEHESYGLDSKARLITLTPYERIVGPGHYEEQGFTFRRTALTSFPPAKFYADVTPFSSPRVFNALALIRQLMK